MVPHGEDASNTAAAAGLHYNTSDTNSHRTRVVPVRLCRRRPSGAPGKTNKLPDDNGIVPVPSTVPLAASRVAARANARPAVAP